MKADSVKIADGVYWVGALDWDARDFHGFTVPGMTYNAYLVFGDEKIALIDNVDAGFYGELKARIEDAFAKEGKDVKIDVLVQNHIENDHLGSVRIPEGRKIPHMGWNQIRLTKDCPILEGVDGRDFYFVHSYH